MWHERRFTPSERKEQVACVICSRAMWLPPSKAAKYITCSDQCRDQRATALRDERERPCETCSTPFLPRTTQLSTGTGRYCCRRCIPTGHLTSAGNLALAVEGLRRASREGRLKGLIGEANPKWRGGHLAMVRRRTESGKAAAEVRAYRRANSHKVREFTLRRRDRRERGKRLPLGTVQRIGAAQRWRCAICAVSILRGFHLDHIEPLAREGKHEPRNVQLTCGACNVRKSAKDPIDYMRSIGRLL